LVKDTRIALKGDASGFESVLSLGEHDGMTGPFLCNESALKPNGFGIEAIEAAAVGRAGDVV
jgi:hypothetical protein